MTSKLLQPIQVGNLTFKNRIMFPPLTTGYEERDEIYGVLKLCPGFLYATTTFCT